MIRALLIYPTHKNCHEQEERYLDAGLNAATYPARRTVATEDDDVNCWNSDADLAEKSGLPAVKSVCLTCHMQSQCKQSGYLRGLMAAGNADIALCTHKRAEYAGLADLTKGRDYVAIHENSINILRPRCSVSSKDLLLVQNILNHLVNDPKYLDWFGTAFRRDAEGRKYTDPELLVMKDRLHQFCLFLADLVDQLAIEMASAAATQELTGITARVLPEGIERLLFQATKQTQTLFEDQPWRLILAAAAGTLETAAVLVDRSRSRLFPKMPEMGIERSLVGYRANTPTHGPCYWFCDATASAECLAALLTHPVNDMTPQGRLPLLKKAVQIPRDIKRSTAASTVKCLLRGVLAERPEFHRIGIICHRPHLNVVKDLGEGFERKVVKVTYFRSGEDRSSNAWQKECDLIIVAGTPRVPQSAIADYLVQTRQLSAASVEPEWGEFHWHGLTESGESVTVSGSGYYDARWQRAHQDLVRAALVQAIGRGRGILADGCEVIVLSTEECGLRISDSEVDRLNEASLNILTVLSELAPQNPNNTSLGKAGAKSEDIARKTGLSRSRVWTLLSKLEHRGLVCKVGERRGWRLVAGAFNPLPGVDSSDSADLTPPLQSAEAAPPSNQNPDAGRTGE
jgi:hypothetical protein